jgi:hypothetical protein
MSEDNTKIYKGPEGNKGNGKQRKTQRDIRKEEPPVVIWDNSKRYYESLRRPSNLGHYRLLPHPFQLIVSIHCSSYHLKPYNPRYKG